MLYFVYRILESYGLVKKYTYKLHIEAEPEGGYTVTVPALPGCVTWGKTYEEAIRMAHEAVEGFLETLAELGEPIPEQSLEIPLDALIQVELSAGV